VFAQTTTTTGACATKASARANSTSCLFVEASSTITKSQGWQFPAEGAQRAASNAVMSFSLGTGSGLKLRMLLRSLTTSNRSTSILTVVGLELGENRSGEDTYEQANVKRCFPRIPTVGGPIG